MLTKAYIQEIIDATTVKVRMPLYNKIEGVAGSTPNSELSTAAISLPPGMIINVNIGDIVILGFEEGNVSKPIVLGFLYSSSQNGSISDITCESLVSTRETTLSKNTIIGDIKYENIECLKNQKENINDVIRRLQLKIDEIETILHQILNT